MNTFSNEPITSALMANAKKLLSVAPDSEHTEVLLVKTE